MWEAGLRSWKEGEEEKRKEAKMLKHRNILPEEGGQPSSLQQLSEEDFDLLKTKLDIGLELLKHLSKAIHCGVVQIAPEGVSTVESAEQEWELKNNSLLISTPCVLESYPARFRLPPDTKRFPANLQAKVPPKEAAPAADPNYEPDSSSG